jgi:hypothetical protein
MNLRVEIADVSSSVLVSLGGVLAEQICTDARRNSSCHSSPEDAGEATGEVRVLEVRVQFRLWRLKTRWLRA